MISFIYEIELTVFFIINRFNVISSDREFTILIKEVKTIILELVLNRNII